MESIVQVAVIVAMIVIGALVIHRLNAQHDDKIPVFHYSDLVHGHDHAPSGHHGHPASGAAGHEDAAGGGPAPDGPAQAHAHGSGRGSHVAGAPPWRRHAPGTPRW